MILYIVIGFGWSVAISGNYAIVGARGDDSFRGSAYILKEIVMETLNKNRNLLLVTVQMASMMDLI